MSILKHRRWKRLITNKFPDAWCAFLRKNVPYYGCLPEEAQAELQGLIQIFLDDKWFEGAAGLIITDEIRVTIAAQACILLLHRKTEIYPKLRTIIVYPNAYLVEHIERMPAGVEIESKDVRHGESWAHGTIVLSWDDVLQGAEQPGDGENLVFHEFAHQLDHEGGATNGAPYLPKRSMYATWAEVLGREYGDLISAISRNRKTLLRSYGATNPAEFFAVITELFFEQPVELMRDHPNLYKQLQLFYEQDPAVWVGRCSD